MIYTVTLNPSVDLLVEIDEIKFGALNRTKNDMIVPGGKGINVSRVLRQLGMPSVATGLTGDFTGEFIKKWLRREDIPCEFIDIDDYSRINIKLIKQDETILNGKGPNVSNQELQDFMYFISRVGEGDIVIISGSIPQNVDPYVYDRIISICKANKARFVIDPPTKYLYEYIKRGPLLIKPNVEDLRYIFKAKIETLEDIVKYGKKTLELGAEYCIVSMGEEGSILLYEDKVYRAEKMEGEYVNSVGSRDAMIAGFISTYIRTSDPLEAYHTATAAASATAFTKDLAKRFQIDAIIDQVVVQDISSIG